MTIAGQPQRQARKNEQRGWSISRYKERQLAKFKAREDEELVSALGAWAVASDLTRDQELVCAWQKKLRARRTVAVRKVWEEAKLQRPEIRAHTITQFAKTHPALDRRDVLTRDR